MTSLPYTQPPRECGDCTMCCQGFLTANIHGYVMSPGIPCHFVGDNSCGGCTIYEDRPEICSGYECMWKKTPSMPEWMKPNKSDVLLTQHTITFDDVEYHYINLKEGYNAIRGDVLNYVMRTCLQYNINLNYEVNGAWYWQGDETWMKKHMESKGFEHIVPVEEPAQDT